MLPIRSITRRRLDQRLAGLDALIGPRPARGWIWAIRDALVMSTFELGQRMGVTASNVSQLERAEGAGSIQLATLERTAQALNCRLWYVLVPNEPLEQMVRRQALDKAAAAVAASAATPLEDQCDGGDGALIADVISEQVEAMAQKLVDSRGLWRTTQANGNEPA
jgi:predicted DNA-binding mobile mystery protein A